MGINLTAKEKVKTCDNAQKKDDGKKYPSYEKVEEAFVYSGLNIAPTHALFHIRACF